MQLDDDFCKDYSSFFKVTKNSASCNLCGDIIESKSNHHFVKCSCGEIFIDGGLDCPRGGANNFDNFNSLTTTRPFTKIEIEKEINRYENASYMENHVKLAKEFRKKLYGI